MSLTILVSIVAVGIALTVAAVHFSGGSKIATIADSGHAHRLFALDYPNEAPGLARLTADSHSAFMELPGGRVGIVQAFGDGFFCRIVSGSDIARLQLREPALVSIRFKDFSWTGGNFAFGEAASAAWVAAALGGDTATKTGS